MEISENFQESICAKIVQKFQYRFFKINMKSHEYDHEDLLWRIEDECQNEYEDEDCGIWRLSKESLTIRKEL